MALRQIRIQGDAILSKKCREIKEMTPRIKELIGDMLKPTAWGLQDRRWAC